MTILFPRRYEGLHPAFVPKDSRVDLLPITAAPPAAALIGGLTFCLQCRKVIALSKTITPPRLATFRTLLPAPTLATKVAAYSFIGCGVLAGLDEYVLDASACTFLRSRGIKVPRQQIFNRLESFESDDASVTGFLGGAAVAAALRRPRMVTGWKRMVGAGCFGSLLSWSTYMIWYTGGSLESIAQIEARAKVRKEQRLKYSAEIDQAWAARWKDVKHTPAPLPPIERPRLSSTTRIFLGHLVPGHQQNGKITYDDREGPHITVKGEVNLDSSSIPATNYKWTTDPERTVSELEHHVEALKTQRQNLARESQLLWQWLAEKEAEYYRLCDDSVSLKAEEKRKMAAYLQILGVQHTNLWLAVSRMDWMIADTQKRIAQHRAREQGGENAVWMPETVPLAQPQRPETALAVLKRKREQVEEHLASLDEKKEAYIKELATGEPGPENKLRPEVKNKLLTRPDWKEHVTQLAEWKREDLHSDKEALDAVIRDIEEKSKQAGDLL